MGNMKCELNVDGMHCAACELLVEKKLSKVAGTKNVKAKLGDQKVSVEFDSEIDKNEFIKQANELLEDDGYKVSETAILKKAFQLSDYVPSFIIAIVIVFAFLLLQRTSLFQADIGENVNYGFIFFLGILASLSSCMAVVGGIVLTLSAKYSSDLKTKPLIAFHISRVIGFFVLGGAIGLIGGSFKLSPLVYFVLNVVLFIVMLLVGFNLLQIFPSLNKFQLRMPKAISKSALNIGEGNNFLTPIIAGVITFFLPCGFTQAVQLYSLETGNALNGALTMLVFSLGTLPALALISFASVKFSKSLQSSLFFKVSGFLILAFAVFNLLSSLVSIGAIKPFLSF